MNYMKIYVWASIRKFARTVFYSRSAPACRVRILPEEMYFFQDSGRNWKKLEETGIFRPFWKKCTWGNLHMIYKLRIHTSKLFMFSAK